MGKMKIAFIVIVTLLILVMIGSRIMGISPLVFKMHKKFFQKNNIAMEGYDLVSYHIYKKAEKGNPEFAAKWENATWIFSSKENQHLFESNPKKYIPQVGGYCTFAVSKGFTAPGNGEFWQFKNDRLYFFSNESVMKDALQNFDDIVESAHKKWN